MTEINNNLAAIDLGTNSFHLVVVKPLPHNKFHILDSGKVTVRLGTGAIDLDAIKEDAMQRGLEAIQYFKKIADSQKAQIHAVATSAVREARNREDFISLIEKECGISINVISGHEEARLIYLGILQALPFYNNQILTIDIGGGSTEFLIGKQGNVFFSASLKLGAIRLKDRFFSTEPLKKNHVEKCRRFIRTHLNGILAETKNLERELAVASSGTAETLHMIAMSHFRKKNKNLEIVTKDEIDKIVKLLLSYDTAKKRLAIDGLDEKRADIIVGAAILMQEIMNAFQIPELHISGYALREGIIYDALNREMDKLSEIRKQSVIHLAEKFHDPRIPRSGASLHIADLSIQLYQECLRIGLIESSGENDPLLLESAAILHNIGLVIAHSSHHKHSAYIIRNTEHLTGFNLHEIEIIAQLARYHRKSFPAARHPEFKLLSDTDKKRVEIMSSILRIATGLDRSGKGVIKEIHLELNDSLVTAVLALNEEINDADPSLEIWSAEMKSELFEQTFRKKVSFRIHSVSQV
ncbi:MAG: Ppx/GppA family phosphatase [Spirochaetia bacterium]|nr:Ppx/GppA family phosphatase [Spirochaetia bacterium]